MRYGALLSSLVLAAAAVACFGDQQRAELEAARGSDAAAEQALAAAARPVEADATHVARLPVDAVRFAPSQVEIVGSGRRSGHELGDVERCDGCHSGVVASFRKSAHAHASFGNPLYRAAVERFRDAEGAVASRFCGGCHDPALLVDGALDEPVEPDDPRAYAGVSCSVCHSIVELRPGGNAGYTLDASPIPIPDLDDEASIRAHVARVKPAPLRDGSLCTACHKAFLSEATGHPHFIGGADDVLPWRRSAFAGSHAERIDVPVAQADCRGCHMQLDEARDYDVSAHDGLLRSHGVRGGHTLLAAMRRDDDELERIAETMREAVRLDIPVARSEAGEPALPAERLTLEPGARVEVDVVVKNLGVGHRFPGGTIDLADTWIEVELVDALGEVLASSGARHASSGRDPEAHRLHARLVDDEGRPLETHEVEAFRASAYDHTVAPRDARVVRYAFTVPLDATSRGPLAVRAALRYRARTLEASTLACDEHRSARGQAFARHSGLDACVEPPIVELAQAEVRFDPVGVVVVEPTLGDRLADHGQAMLHAVQEELERARPSLEAALSIAEAEGDDLRAARALHLLGDLEGRLGRVDDAMRTLDRAEALAPGHPAIGYARGRSLAQVWRFDRAVPYYETAALGAPKDELAWAALAIARSSAGDQRGALEATMRGLTLAPRQPDLLRVQALALRALDPGGLGTELAWLEQLAHRTADAAPALRRRCADRVQGCDREREPVHVHELRPRR